MHVLKYRIERYSFFYCVGESFSSVYSKGRFLPRYRCTATVTNAICEQACCSEAASHPSSCQKKHKPRSGFLKRWPEWDESGVWSYGEGPVSQKDKCQRLNRDCGGSRCMCVDTVCGFWREWRMCCMWLSKAKSEQSGMCEFNTHTHTCRELVSSNEQSYRMDNNALKPKRKTTLCNPGVIIIIRAAHEKRKQIVKVCQLTLFSFHSTFFLPAQQSR